MRAAAHDTLAVVGVARAVWVGEGAGDGVDVGTSVGGTGVAVGNGVAVGVSVGVSVGVAVGSGVEVAVAVATGAGQARTTVGHQVTAPTHSTPIATTEIENKPNLAR